jgi:hypothetical protein
MGGQTTTAGKTGNPADAASQFDLAALGSAAGTNATAMHNRYQQLGIAVPGGLDPSGENLVGGGPSTMEQQDLSMIPTTQGGVDLGLLAASGQLQNQQQNNPIFNGTALNTLAQQAGFQAGASGGGTSAFNPGDAQPGGNFSSS